MTPITLRREQLAVSIEQVRRRYRWILEETRVHAPASWSLTRDVLSWHVVLDDILEPDIDVELLDDALVVRAGHPAHTLLSLLVVPAPFDVRQANMRFAAGVLIVELTAGGE